MAQEPRSLFPAIIFLYHVEGIKYFTMYLSHQYITGSFIMLHHFKHLMYKTQKFSGIPCHHTCNCDAQ
jgi:hypothetical protein